MNEQDQIKEALKIVLMKGMSELRVLGKQGKERMELRSLQKKRDKMYLKLGKETALLLEQGEIQHLGLNRAFQKLQEIQAEIVEAEKKEREKIADDTKSE